MAHADDGSPMAVLKHDEQKQVEAGMHEYGDFRTPYYRTDIYHSIRVTVKADAVTINKVIVNRDNCLATPSIQLPALLHFGDTVEVRVYCNAIETSVVTDKDTLIFSFDN